MGLSPDEPQVLRAIRIQGLLLGTLQFHTNCFPTSLRNSVDLCYFKLPNSEHFKCVPKTCCFGAKLGETEGRNLLGGSVAVSSATGRCNWGTGDACPQEVVLSQSIYVRGCLDILSEMYSSDLVNLLLLYGLGGTVFVLIELVAVALAFAYAAQLNGRVVQRFPLTRVF